MGMLSRETRFPKRLGTGAEVCTHGQRAASGTSLNALKDKAKSHGFRAFCAAFGRMEIVVGGKSSRVADAIPELNLEHLEPIVERIVKRVVAPARRLMTVKELAQANGIGLTLAYEELNTGRLEAIKVGSKTMITPEAEAAWKARLPRYKPTGVLPEDLESA
jgi:hypothetical protein